MESTIVENDCHQTAANLKGLPVMIRTGGTTVSVVLPARFRAFSMQACDRAVLLVVSSASALLVGSS